MTGPDLALARRMAREASTPGALAQAVGLAIAAAKAQARAIRWQQDQDEFEGHGATSGK